MSSARILPSPANAPRARVVVADDHPICSQLLPTLLEKIGCEVVGVAYDGEMALARCEELKPDILLLDIILPKVGGLEVLQRIRRRALPIKIILFTGSLQSEMLREAMVWGVEGCLLKTAPVQEIAEAFQRVRAGQLAFGPEASELMRKLVVSQDEAGALSELETAVLRQTARGQPIKEMAVELRLSESGVYKVLDRVKRKVGAHSLQELTLAAVRRGLLSV